MATATVNTTQELKTALQKKTDKIIILEPLSKKFAKNPITKPTKITKQSSGISRIFGVSCLIPAIPPAVIIAYSTGFLICSIGISLLIAMKKNYDCMAEMGKNGEIKVVLKKN